MNVPKINWSLISYAQSFHSENFNYIEVPWVVKHQRAIEETIPVENHQMIVMYENNVAGYLVGSAEQSFINMMIEDNLPDGKYMSASPCFRDDVIDNLHQQQFFKVELIDVFNKQKSANSRLNEMVEAAFKCFASLIDKSNLNIVEAHSGLDIELGGIEVGSYGYRTLELHDGSRHWIYGTAMAEPRFSIASEMNRERH